jgi:hypothetical protein
MNKYSAQNAGNDISGIQIPKIKGGGECPWTPIVIHPPLENLHPL